MNLPKDGFVKEAYQKDYNFKSTIEEFLKYIEEIVKKGESKLTKDNYNDLYNITKKFNFTTDASEKVNETAWRDLIKKLNTEPWKSLNQKGTEYAGKF